jgi:hypothetical protein
MTESMHDPLRWAWGHQPCIFDDPAIDPLQRSANASPTQETET